MNAVGFRASLMASSKRRVRHHIQNTQFKCPSTRPLSPDTAVLADAPSVPISTSFAHFSAEISVIPRPFSPASNTLKRPLPVTDCGRTTVKCSIRVWILSSIPSRSHHTARISSLSMLAASVDPSRSKKRSWHGQAFVLTPVFWIQQCSGSFPSLQFHWHMKCQGRLHGVLQLRKSEATW